MRVRVVATGYGAESVTRATQLQTYSTDVLLIMLFPHTWQTLTSRLLGIHRRMNGVSLRKTSSLGIWVSITSVNAPKTFNRRSLETIDKASRPWRTVLD